MAKSRKPLHPDAPLRLNNHHRPVTRRELIAQGFMTGGAGWKMAPVMNGDFELVGHRRQQRVRRFEGGLR